jgi:cobalt transporter subunit CbtA
MFRPIFTTAIVSGLAAGLLASAIQTVRVVPLIHEAEVYEYAEAARVAADRPAAAPDPAHERDAEGWQPREGVERIAYTVAADVVVATGFAMILVGAFALSGRAIDGRRGLLWGLAGYAVFSLAPSLGLTPEMPGAAPEAVANADLLARQAWWIGTAAATAAGLALLVYAPRWFGRVAGFGFLIAPHLIGAPHRVGVESVVPAALRREFVFETLLAAGLFWLALGGLSGWLYRRLAWGSPSRGR